MPDCSLINGKTKAAHAGIVCSLSVEQPFAMALLHCSILVREESLQEFVVVFKERWWLFTSSHFLLKQS